jgi:hypothetical protein
MRLLGHSFRLSLPPNQPVERDGAMHFRRRSWWVEVNTSWSSRRSVPRYGFSVIVEITDLQSGTRIRGSTNDICLFGCGVDTMCDFTPGTKVRIQLIRETTKQQVVALGRVVYSQQAVGTGIVFTSIEEADQRELSNWIAELERSKGI